MPQSPPDATGRDEQTVYGVRAALAVLVHRPQDVRRIYHGQSLRRELAPHLSLAAGRHIPYRELDPAELAKVAGSPHHEGLVVAAAPLRYRSLESRGTGAPAGAELWLAVDGVENPHNLGALLRTAAFFGLAGVLAGGVEPGEKVNAAVLRVSEGGAERIPLYAALSLTEGLGALRGAGCRVLGLETDGARVLGDAIDQGDTEGPLVLVLGQERAGLSAAARSACDGLCQLAGAGPMASLNVSVAAAVALAEVARGRAQRRGTAQAWSRPTPARPPRATGQRAAAQRDQATPQGARGVGPPNEAPQRQAPPRPRPKPGGGKSPARKAGGGKSPARKAGGGKSPARKAGGGKSPARKPRPSGRRG